MKKRILTAANAYEKTFSDKNDTSGAFYYTDILEVAEAVNMEDGISKETLCDAIMICFEAAFMIGYRKAQRDNRKRK